jgi:hypothetical protein
MRQMTLEFFSGQEDGIDYLVSLNEELLHNISQNDNEGSTVLGVLVKPQKPYWAGLKG